MAAKADNLTTEAADKRELPRHVAVIMDGNGRWAEQRGKPRYAGHRAGVKPVRLAVEKAAENGLDCLTLFAFSSENWRRPAEEVSRLMGLLIDVLRREIDELHRNDVRLRFVGQVDRLSERLQKSMRDACDLTADNRGLTLVIAVAYGGRWDITQAARGLAAQVGAGEIALDDIDEDRVAKSLVLGDLPDPDLLIRTGGEKRISNFLLWNLAYSEFHFSDALWPDFDAAELDVAIADFTHRQRRFGRTSEQVSAG